MSLRLCSFTAPSGPPRNVRVSVLSAHSVNLTWSPPHLEDCSGFISGYRVRVTLSDLGSSIQLTSNAGYLVVNDLLPHRTYNFVVAAHTAVGDGPFSSPVTILTDPSGMWI